MVEIIPAIMPENLKDLRGKVARVKGLVPLVQIDVMDGEFVPEKSWPYTASGTKEFQDCVRQGSLPYWDEIEYEVDLMVARPEKVVQEWMALQVRRIIIHIESTNSIHDIISRIEKECSRESEEGICHTERGLALSTATPNETLEPYIHDIDFVQLMGIEKIGYQGQPFDKRVLEKIKSLRHLHPHLIISVDGGVNMETAPALVRAGATRLVSGSAIFTSTDIGRTITTFAHLS
ncbi:hypothetical protein HYW58_02095 [Candidatus Kaiserbacteria bacterium]|nr:hypothetical protein [Candidatus Kaiserbacteria bacterium]